LPEEKILAVSWKTFFSVVKEIGMSREAAACVPVIQILQTVNRNSYLPSYHRYLGGAVLEGGSETSASLLASIILCFTAFPEALQKAQKEIDVVLPDGRPPTLDDIASLPYIRAILREVSCSSRLPLVNSAN
jgi:hypothetical protein